MKLLLALTIAAHAGWFADFCARYLVADDPTQFEHASDEWLARERTRLEIKRAWGKADAHDLTMLKIVSDQIAQNEFFQTLKQRGAK